MAIKQTTPNEYVQQHLERRIAAGQKALIDTFCYVGESCIKVAREEGNFTDRTGNLRSSIGYVVAQNGKAVMQGGFEQVMSGAEGAKEGAEYIKLLLSKHTKGVVLIVVAGMNYALYVELNNYEVLGNAQLHSRKMVPQILKKLGFIMP